MTAAERRPASTQTAQPDHGDGGRSLAVAVCRMLDADMVGGGQETQTMLKAHPVHLVVGLCRSGKGVGELGHRPAPSIY